MELVKQLHTTIPEDKPQTAKKYENYETTENIKQDINIATSASLEQESQVAKGKVYSKKSAVHKEL